MTKLMIRITSLALASMLLSGQASATLIGDTVDVGIFNGFSRITGFGLDDPFVVEAGASDAQQYSTQFIIDFESEGFSVDYSIATSTGWTSGVELRVFDLDWVNIPSGIITGLIISTNISGWNDSLASFTDHTATFEWGTLGFNTSSFFDVSFQTDHLPTIPEPATLALFGLGLAGLRFTKTKHA